MFDPKILANLVRDYRPAFQKLVQIENELNNRFADLAIPIRALILSVASGEPLLLIGPPGTGKSHLIRAFCGLIGLVNEDDPSQDHPYYFEYLLTPFTEPSELFGFYDISQALQGNLNRIEDNMIQQAKVVYLDEVFNGSSAILNSILAFLNERIFHDRGMRKRVAMQAFFAATNRVPEMVELAAVFDRFVLRCMVDNVMAQPELIDTLLQAAWPETYGRHQPLADFSSLLEELALFRKKIIDLTTKGALLPQRNQPFYRHLAQLVQHARQYNLSEMSNRRLVKMTYVMLVHRVYEAVRQEEQEKIIEHLVLGPAELQLLPRYFLDRADEEITQKMERLAGR